MNTAEQLDVASHYSLEHLSNEDLLASARVQVGRSNQLLATLLAHLAEVEARGLHRTRACSSVYTYCIYELRMSEDAAWRRAHAARIARRFPVLFDQIAAGEIHLTGLLLLAPHLTDANHLEILARAKHRTKREIAALVRVLDPLPDVPARIEPLGPSTAATASRTSLAGPRSSQFTAALAGPVRELAMGDRPRDWAEIDVPATPERTGTILEQQSTDDGATDFAPTSSLAPQRFKVQFTATQEYVDLLEEARDLLAHAVPDRGLAEVHLRAMRALVLELKKRKYAMTSHAGAAPEQKPAPAHEPAPARQRRTEASLCEPVDRNQPATPRQRGRYLPAAVRRAVAERDAERCAFIDADGRRCGETRALEFHHLDPHARGGPATVANLSLRCRSHNALAAEHDFGREFMEKRRTGRPWHARLDLAAFA